jgi:hypothetical protein
VSPLTTVQEIKSRLSDQLNIPITEQKLVLKGKPLHDGSLEDYHIADGTKLHLIVSTHYSTISTKPVNSAFLNELRLLASEWIQSPNEREAFVTAFQRVNNTKRNLNRIISFLYLQEMKNAVDHLSLDDIEKLCADRLNQSV